MEITNGCNFACPFCSPSNREKTLMDIGLFEKVAREVKPLCDYIYFHVLGEPLTHPLFSEFVEISKNYGLNVNITTNGALIDKIQNPHQLRKVSISIHSIFYNDVDRFSYYKGVANFILQNPDLIIELRLLDEHALINENIEAREQLGKMLGAYIGEKSGKIFANLYVSYFKLFSWPGGEVETHNTFCYGLRDQFAVLSDGTVTPCCLDSEGRIPLGNIREDSLENILFNDRAQALKQGFSEGRAVEKLCRSCDFKRK